MGGEQPVLQMSRRGLSFPFIHHERRAQFPAFRYVPVTDAVVANNSFYNCTPISFCEGSDAERSTPPSNVYFFNNTFYNNRDSLIYHVYDNISGISFANNIVSKAVPQPLTKGFTKTSLQEDRKVNVTWTSAPGINPQSFYRTPWQGSPAG
jgi:hypothetical protein